VVRPGYRFPPCPEGRGGLGRWDLGSVSNILWPSWASSGEEASKARLMTQLMTEALSLSGCCLQGPGHTQAGSGSLAHQYPYLVSIVRSPRPPSCPVSFLSIPVLQTQQEASL
jgi:hypothetical protein